MDLPENLKVFPFDATGDTTYKKYDGDFTVKCVLNLLEKRMLEVEKSQIRADMANPTSDLLAYSTILANLRVRIQNGPEWWKQSNGGYALLDENVVIELFDKVMEQEKNWRDALRSKVENKEGNLEKGK